MSEGRAPSRARNTLVRVPRDLGAVTRIDRALEKPGADPDLAGQAMRRVWASVERLYRTGLHPGISLVLRRRGEVLLARGIGHAFGNAPDDPPDAPQAAMTAHTPVCLFSASKAITAMLVHRAAERGELALDAPVADYLPEYAACGKGGTTIRQLLAHRGGVPRIPAGHADASLLWDWERAVSVLCAAEPLHGAGEQQAYHAITAGYILGEVLRRTTGRELRPLLRDAFAEPLGARYLSYGLPPRERRRAARNAFTGPPLPWGLAWAARRALGVPFEQVVEISHDRRFFEAVIPAGNIYASAEDVCRFFEMLRCQGRWQGRRLLAPTTVAAAVAPYGPLRFDRTLLVPVRFSAGLILGEHGLSLYGWNCPRAFGHLGFINTVCWADPDRDLSVALLTTGKPLNLGSVVGLARVIRAISRQCPPARGRRAAISAV